MHRSILMEVVVYSKLVGKYCNFIRKRLRLKSFLVNFTIIFRTPFLRTPLGDCRFYLHSSEFKSALSSPKLNADCEEVEEDFSCRLDLENNEFYQQDKIYFITSISLNFIYFFLFRIRTLFLNLSDQR